MPKSYRNLFGPKGFNASTDELPDRIDHVHIDVAADLHIIMAACKPRVDELVKKRGVEHATVYVGKVLANRLQSYARILRPRKSITIAFDGPAPLAKAMVQMRRRRQDYVQIKAELEKGHLLTELAITPGTTFLLHMHTVVVDWAGSHLPRFPFIEVCVSDSTVPGEGELKIMDRVAQISKTRPHDHHFIVSCDSDMLVMSLFAQTRNIYVGGAVFASRPNTFYVPAIVEKVESLMQLTDLNACPELLGNNEGFSAAPTCTVQAASSGSDADVSAAAPGAEPKRTAAEGGGSEAPETSPAAEQPGEGESAEGGGSKAPETSPAAEQPGEGESVEGGGSKVPETSPAAEQLGGRESDAASSDSAPPEPREAGQRAARTWLSRGFVAPMPGQPKPAPAEASPSVRGSAGSQDAAADVWDMGASSQLSPRWASQATTNARARVDDASSRNRVKSRAASPQPVATPAAPQPAPNDAAAKRARWAAWRATAAAPPPIEVIRRRLESRHARQRGRIGATQKVNDAELARTAADAWNSSVALPSAAARGGLPAALEGAAIGAAQGSGARGEGRASTFEGPLSGRAELGQGGGPGASGPSTEPPARLSGEPEQLPPAAERDEDATAPTPAPTSSPVASSAPAPADGADAPNGPSSEAPGGAAQAAQRPMPPPGASPPATRLKKRMLQATLRDIGLVCLLPAGNDYFCGMFADGQHISTQVCLRRYVRLRQDPQFARRSFTVVHAASRAIAFDVEFFLHYLQPLVASFAANSVAASGKEQYARDADYSAKLVPENFTQAALLQLALDPRVVARVAQARAAREFADPSNESSDEPSDEPSDGNLLGESEVKDVLSDIKPLQHLRAPDGRGYLAALRWNLEMYGFACCFDFRSVYAGEVARAADVWNVLLDGWRAHLERHAGEALPQQFTAADAFSLPKRPPGAPLLLYAPDYGRLDDPAAGWTEYTAKRHEGCWYRQHDGARFPESVYSGTYHVASHHSVNDRELIAATDGNRFDAARRRYVSLAVTHDLAGNERQRLGGDPPPPASAAGHAAAADADGAARDAAAAGPSGDGVADPGARAAEAASNAAEDAPRGSSVDSAADQAPPTAQESPLPAPVRADSASANGAAARAPSPDASWQDPLPAQPDAPAGAAPMAPASTTPTAASEPASGATAGGAPQPSPALCDEALTHCDEASVRSARVAQTSVRAANVLPLRPDVTALMLLPSQLKHLMPSSVRRLLAPGSILVEISKPCELCLEATRSLGALQKARTALRVQASPTSTRPVISNAVAAALPARLVPLVLEPDGELRRLLSQALSSLNDIKADVPYAEDDEGGGEPHPQSTVEAEADGATSSPLEGDPAEAPGDSSDDSEEDVLALESGEFLVSEADIDDAASLTSADEGSDAPDAWVDVATAGSAGGEDVDVESSVHARSDEGVAAVADAAGDTAAADAVGVAAAADATGVAAVADAASVAAVAVSAGVAAAADAGEDGAEWSRCSRILRSSSNVGDPFLARLVEFVDVAVPVVRQELEAVLSANAAPEPSTDAGAPCDAPGGGGGGDASWAADDASATTGQRRASIPAEAGLAESQPEDSRSEAASASEQEPPRERDVGAALSPDLERYLQLNGNLTEAEAAAPAAGSFSARLAGAIATLLAAHPRCNWTKFQLYDVLIEFDVTRIPPQQDSDASHLPDVCNLVVMWLLVTAILEGVRKKRDLRVSALLNRQNALISAFHFHKHLSHFHEANPIGVLERLALENPLHDSPAEELPLYTWGLQYSLVRSRFAPASADQAKFGDAFQAAWKTTTGQGGAERCSTLWLQSQPSLQSHVMLPLYAATHPDRVATAAQQRRRLAAAAAPRHEDGGASSAAAGQGEDGAAGADQNVEGALHAAAADDSQRAAAPAENGTGAHTDLAVDSAAPDEDVPEVERSPQSVAPQESGDESADSRGGAGDDAGGAEDCGKAAAGLKAEAPGAAGSAHAVGRASTARARHARAFAAPFGGGATGRRRRVQSAPQAVPRGGVFGGLTYGASGSDAPQASRSSDAAEWRASAPLVLALLGGAVSGHDGFEHEPEFDGVIADSCDLLERRLSPGSARVRDVLGGSRPVEIPGATALGGDHGGMWTARLEASRDCVAAYGPTRGGALRPAAPGAGRRAVCGAARPPSSRVGFHAGGARVGRAKLF